MSPDAWLSQLQALLPPGLAWPRHPDAVLTRLLGPIAAQMSRIDGRAAELLREADPRQTLELLAEWEADTGQPDPCAGPAVTLTGRRGRVLAKLLGRPGGQSIAYYTALAARYGQEIAIEEFRPFRAGARAGDRCRSVAWHFAWRVQGYAGSPTRFRAGRSIAGDRLAEWGNQILECVIRRTAPAHSHVLFGYPDYLADDDGEPLLSDGDERVVI